MRCAVLQISLSPFPLSVLGSNGAVKLRKTNQTDNEEKVCCAREGRDGRDGLPGPPGPQGLAGVLGERRKVEGGKGGTQTSVINPFNI